MAPDGAALMRAHRLVPPRAPFTGLGLMSGTSADAVDAAVVQFAPAPGGGTELTLLAYRQTPYPAELRRRLLRLMEPGRGRVADLPGIDGEVALAFVEAGHRALADVPTRGLRLDFVASHGQTVWHDPRRDGHRGGTLQIGDGAILARGFGTWVVNDFRRADMAAGGQGAPLVPVTDALLFGDPGAPRITLNLGGVANLTALSAGEAPSVVAAFDTGPANLLMDSLAQEAGAGMFDRDGALAVAGQVRQEVLDALMADPYFSTPPPKTTGREAWGRHRARELMAAWPGLPAADLLATAAELTARSVADAIHRFLPPEFAAAEVVTAGGGAHNPELMARLRRCLAPAAVTPLDRLGGHVDAREAVAFALLGYLFLAGLPGDAPSATGARAPALCGCLWPPPEPRRPLVWPSPD